jgi:hypothetical protein
MPAAPKPNPAFRSLRISIAGTILAVSNPHRIKLLHFDCNATLPEWNYTIKPQL